MIRQCSADLEGAVVAELADGGVVEVEELLEDVLGVFAVAGSGPVEAAADVGGCLGECDRVFLDWPGADFGLREFDEPAEVGELRVGFVPVFGGLAYAGRDVMCLKRVHQRVGVVVSRGCRDERVEVFLVLDPRLKRREAGVGAPGGRAECGDD